MPLILIPPIEDLEFSITNGIVSSKIYDKRDDVNFDIVTFSFWIKMFVSPISMVYIFLNIFFCESMS